MEVDQFPVAWLCRNMAGLSLRGLALALSTWSQGRTFQRVLSFRRRWILADGVG